MYRFLVSGAVAMALSGQALADFCSDPLGTVCAPGTWGRARRVARITGVRRQLELKAAQEALAAKAGGCPGTSTKAELAWLSEDRRRVAQLDFVARIGRSAAVQETIARVRESMATLAGDDAAAAKLVRGAKVMLSLQDLPDDVAASDSLVTDFLAAYENFCGEDGWREGSFTYRLNPKGKKTNRLLIVICPGWLAAAPPDPASAARNLAGVWGHELGHGVVLAQGVHAIPAVGYLACLVKRFGPPRPGETTIADDDRKELLSDYWSQRALEEELKRVENAPPPRKLAVLRGALSGLCGRPLVDDHPAGNYRVRALLEGDAAVMSAMGCKPVANSCIPQTQ